MISGIPSFERDQAALLVSAVQTTLEYLREANQRAGGNDNELIEYGRRYAVLLQKLEAVANTCMRDLTFLPGLRRFGAYFASMANENMKPAI
jgi:hypothetical protein